VFIQPLHPSQYYIITIPAGFEALTVVVKKYSPFWNIMLCE
jgi:hypothetical protein